MLNEYEYGVCISTDTKDSSKRILVLQIGNVVAGVGCRKGTAMQILEQGISETTARHGLDQRQLEAIVSIDLKAEETGLNELSEKWKVPFIHVRWATEYRRGNQQLRICAAGYRSG